MSGWKVSLSSKMETVWEFAFFIGKGLPFWVNIASRCFKSKLRMAPDFPRFPRPDEGLVPARLRSYMTIKENDLSATQIISFSLCLFWYSMSFQYVSMSCLFQWPIWLFDAARNDGSRESLSPECSTMSPVAASPPSFLAPIRPTVSALEVSQQRSSGFMSCKTSRNNWIMR